LGEFAYVRKAHERAAENSLKRAGEGGRGSSIVGRKGTGIVHLSMVERFERKLKPK